MEQVKKKESPVTGQLLVSYIYALRIERSHLLRLYIKGKLRQPCYHVIARERRFRPAALRPIFSEWFAFPYFVQCASLRTVSRGMPRVSAGETVVTVWFASSLAAVEGAAMRWISGFTAGAMPRLAGASRRYHYLQPSSSSSDFTFSSRRLLCKEARTIRYVYNARANTLINVLIRT